MAILTALQSAAIRLIGRKPSTVYGASGTFEMEIADLANEVAQDVAKYQDWQALVRVANITGNGEVEEFALPSDYDRMLVGGAVQDLDSWAWGYHAYGDINAFLYAQERGFTGSPGGWIIYADKIRFSPPPASGAAARSEEHTSELQSLLRTSYAVFCLK